MFGWRIIDCLTSMAANCCRPGMKINHELTLSSLASVGMKIRCIASGRCPNMESAPFGHLRLTDRENQTMRLLDASVLNGNFIQTKQTNWDLSIFRCQVGKGPGFVPGFGCLTKWHKKYHKKMAHFLHDRTGVGRPRIPTIESKGKHFIGWFICIQFTL